MAYSLYIHTSPKGLRYVGITGQKPSKRWSKGAGYHTQPRFYNAILKYGWNSFHHEILLSGLSKFEAEEKERFYISLFRSNDSRFGYNLDSGGSLGKTMSCETKQKISKALVGRHQTEEAKRKFRAKVCGKNHHFYGKHLSEAHRKKTSDSLKGKRVSPETKAKLSVAAIRDRGCSVINTDTGEVFESITAASKKYGSTTSNICKCLNGIRNTAGGYHWARLDGGLHGPD